MFLDKAFDAGLKEIHNGWLLQITIYGKTVGDLHYPQFNGPLTYFKTREEALQAAAQAVAWIAFIQPKEVVTVGKPEKKAQTKKENS